MAVTVSLNKYHHIVIVAQDAAEAVKLWSKVFGFEPPKLNELGKLDFKMIKDAKYPSILRGKDWDWDFKQAVFNQHSFFFEVNEPGTDDNFADFVNKHGNGVAYIGMLIGEDREAFLEMLEKDYGCETVLEHYFPGGDWSVNYAEKILGVDLCVKKLSGGDHTVNPVMPDFAGLTILVDNLDEKLINWKKVFGVEKVESYAGIVRVEYQGEKCDISVKAAEISDGLFPIHLIEAGLAGPFADYYHIHGNGVFQITVPGRGEFRRSTESRLIEEEFEELLKYELFGKSYVVYDTVNRMGANIALV